MVKKFKPRTPGQRKLVLPSFDEITSKEPHKPFLISKRRTNGRNNVGHVTCRHRGGGHKKKYRLVDFKREKGEIPARIATIEYDPNRSAFIALLNYADGEKRYILAPQGIRVGDNVMSTEKPLFKTGNCMKLKDMPIGSTIHNIEIEPGRGGRLVRSAGSSAQLQARSDGYATIKMPSGEIRLILENCRATLGAVSNAEHNQQVIGKAGRNRWKGKRPTVRGVAMNPVDHPHGGGEGKGKGNHPQSPLGLYAKGLRTRRKKKSNRLIVKRRRNDKIS